MRVRIALEEKGIKYEYKEEHLVEQERSTLLLQSNPVYKKILVLIHNNKPICESLIILQYIDSTWNDKFPLMPFDPYQKAHARFWAEFVERKNMDEQRRGARSRQIEFIESLKLLEGELGEKPYFGGETMGLVDVAFVPHFSWFYAYEKCGNFSVEAACPKLVEWAKRCMTLDSVAKSLPDQEKIYDLVLTAKKKMGLEYKGFMIALAKLQNCVSLPKLPQDC